jgi:hypothetical protein
VKRSTSTGVRPFAVVALLAALDGAARALDVDAGRALLGGVALGDACVAASSHAATETESTASRRGHARRKAGGLYSAGPC